MISLFLFHNAPIRNKLLLISMFTTTLVLFLASTIFIVTELLSLRQSMIRDVSGLAQTVDLNVRSAVIFQDDRAAQETLRTLNAFPNISLGAIYSGSGTIFASYRRTGSFFDPTAGRIPLHYTYHFSLSHIDLYRPIIADGGIIGTVYLRSDLRAFYSRVFLYSLTLLGVMGISLIMSYILLTKLQNAVTKPIFDLTALMKRISAGKNFSLRTIVHAKDEIGFLAERFNEMLDNIQTRDEELESYRKSLEEKVLERTFQLSEANRRLQQELAERLRVEQALRESEHRYKAIFETTGSATIIVEDDNRISMANTSFENLTGYPKEDIENKKDWMEFFVKEEIQTMARYRELRKISPGAAPLSYETRLVDRLGKIHEVYAMGSLIPSTSETVLSLLDLTELKHLELQLAQSQKMEAVGKLAGGVAHDFNNILTGIIGYASLIDSETDASELKMYADSIISCSEKATHLTRALLTFSRKQIISPKSLDLNVTVRNVQNLLMRLMGEDIELISTYEEGPINVFADPGQMEQVLINLATNARDAMADGGCFSIKTEVVRFDELSASKHACEAGRYAVITVSDTGTGMTKETMDQIFEPFFTTKEVGKGTGLGLSIVYGIVKQHNGYINVYSEPGIGTTFKVYLPLVMHTVSEDKDVVRKAPLRGTETVLLAEDDEAIRRLIKLVLEKYGYSVITAADGEDALTQFKDNQDGIGIVILDVIMPKKNGKIVHEGIKEIRPDTKALFISGYTADIIHKRGIFEEDINFLTKPIVPDVLLEKVREILDS